MFFCSCSIFSLCIDPHFGSWQFAEGSLTLSVLMFWGFYRYKRRDINATCRIPPVYKRHSFSAKLLNKSVFQAWEKCILKGNIFRGLRGYFCMEFLLCLNLAPVCIHWGLYTEDTNSPRPELPAERPIQSSGPYGGTIKESAFWIRQRDIKICSGVYCLC